MKNNGNYQDDPVLVTDILDAGYFQQIVTDSISVCEKQEYIPIEKLSSMKTILKESEGFCIQKGTVEKNQHCTVSVVSSIPKIGT